MYSERLSGKGQADNSAINSDYHDEALATIATTQRGSERVRERGKVTKVDNTNKASGSSVEIIC